MKILHHYVFLKRFPLHNYLKMEKNCCFSPQQNQSEWWKENNRRDIWMKLMNHSSHNNKSVCIKWSNFCALSWIEIKLATKMNGPKEINKINCLYFGHLTVKLGEGVIPNKNKELNFKLDKVCRIYFIFLVKQNNFLCF